MLRFKSFILSALLLVVGYLLVGSPALPDEFFGWQKKIGVLLVLVFFVRQTMLWGNLLLHRFFSEACVLSKDFEIPILSLPVGSTFLATLILGIGCLGGIGQSFLPLAIAILFVPNIFTAPKFQRVEVLIEDESLEPFSKKFNKLLIVAMCIGILTYVLDTFSLKGHGDVFTYHLSGPRLWFDAGRIMRMDHYPGVHQTGLWDTFYLWGVELLSSSEGRGSVASQHFAQWLHVLVGYGGTAGVLYLFFRSIGCSKSFSLVGAFAGISAHELNPTYAKNDWGSTFWVISGAACVEWGQRVPQIKKRIWWLGGFLLGCGFAAKWTTLFFIFSWGIFLLFRNSFIEISILGCGFLVGAIPLMLRNQLQILNPFFPTYNNFFHSPYLIPSLEAYLVQFEGGKFLLSYEKSKTIINEILKDTFYPFLMLLIPALLVWKRKFQAQKTFMFLGLSILIGLTLFLGKVGSTTPTRLAGPLLVMLSAFGPLLVLQLFSSSKGLKNRFVQAILLVVLLAESHFPIYAIHRLVRVKPSNETLQEFTGGRWKAWVRMHLPLGSHLVHTDGEYYYLLGYPSQIFPEVVETKVPKILETHYEDSEWLFKALTPAGTDYLIFGTGRAEFAKLEAWIISRNPSAILYKDADSTLVVDVKRF